MPTNVASPATRSANAALQSRLPFDDTADFEDAARGLLGRLEPCIVRADDGRVVWDNDAYKFLDGRP
jgi:alkyl sulfatase BDS1-like metallo-beta-lactamase superfamily hydrolase